MYTVMVIAIGISALGYLTTKSVKEKDWEDATKFGLSFFLWLIILHVVMMKSIV